MNDTEILNHPPTRNWFLYWLSVVGVVVGLYFTTRINYLLFHSIVELFSVIIASTVFIITWNSLRYIKNPYLIILGISYLFIGGFDLLHTLSYSGMRIFTDYDYYANQLWIAARYMESVTLLVGFTFLYAERKANPRLLFCLYFVASVLLVLSIFYWKTFPVCFIAGQGQTTFKIYSEYLICGILAASIYMLTKNRRLFSRSVYNLLFLSMVFAIISEMAFTIYVHNYGISNLVGHYFKLFSFLMIYQAIVSTGIEEPYHLIFNELYLTNRSLQKEIELREETERERERATEALRASEAALKELNQDLERRVAERTAELQAKDQLLLVQGRQAAMGEMISNIAHQWRQPLNTLALVVQEVLLTYELGEMNNQYLEKFTNTSMQLIQHMSRTIDDFRNFFKPDKERVLFSINEVVAKTLSLVEGTFRAQQIAIEVKSAGDVVIGGFPNEFSQVLLNILINARDVVTERKVASPRVVITVGKEEDRSVVIITDNAGGVPDEIIDKIFEPYFTTKGPQAGTGVGLSMSKSIIEKNMGGHLTVRNVENGAEFRIEI